MLTEKEKQAVAYLRKGKICYTTIALLLNLTRDIVKDYCIKQNINGDKDKAVAAKKRKRYNFACEYCGKPVNNSFFKKGRKNRFCCERCRRKWWAEHPEKSNRRETAFYHFTCKRCKKEFTAYGEKNRQFCSVSCAVNYRYYD